MIQGWCPNLFTPMQSGDGWLVRVAPRRSVLSAADAWRIAAAASQHGSGIIELTNRGNLQIRGLTQASAGLFAEAMVAAGIASRRAGHPMLVSPVIDADPSVAAETMAIADALETALADADDIGGQSNADDIGGLPDKFLFVVDGGGAAGLRNVRADIAVRSMNGAWGIWLDGEPLGAACEAGLVAEAVLGLARHFLANAGGARRMRDFVRSAGSAGLFQAVNLVAYLAPAANKKNDWIGFQALTGQTGGFALGIPFGQMTADGLRDLAAWSEQFGDATLRITPWRSVILAGVPIGLAAALGQAAIGWITDRTDPRLYILACPGQPGCQSATVAARADAELLATLPLQSLVHVSGCAKGCAHPFPAPITLVGQNGTYSLIRNGRANDFPTTTGLTLAEAKKMLMETL